MNEAHLARLRDAFTVREASQAEQLSALVDAFVEAEVQEQARDRRASSTFTRVTVNDDNVFAVGHQPLAHLINELN